MMDKTLRKDRIDKLIDTVMSVARGDYSVQVEHSVKNDELDSLAIGLNMMIDDIRTSEAELRVKDSAIASSINAITIADLEGNLTYVNPSFLKMWGYDDEKEVLGGKAVELWQMQEQAAEVIQALQEKGSWEGELTATKKDGTRFDVRLSASMITDKTGKPINIMGSFIDITEHKKTEIEREKLIKDLEASLERIQTLSGLIPICAWCKKIRDDKGYWESVEAYIGERTKAEFTHGMCPECAEKYWAGKGS